MTIEELKHQIELNAVTDSPLIFKDDETMFLSDMYIKAISKTKNLPVKYIQSLSEVVNDPFDFFACETDEQPSCLNVLHAQVYEWADVDIARTTNLIVVTTKFSNKDIEKKLSDYIVVMPKLEDWQIKDYVYSICEGVNHKDLDWLMNICGKNVCRLQQELDKLTLFNVDERKYLFDSFVRDGSMDDLSSYNIFNFTNAITSKDFNMLRSIYKEIERADITDFYLLTVLLKNFRNILMVQLNSNPTPESTGLDSKQLYAIRRIPRVYSAEQLVKIFDFLCDIDRQVKEGELPASLVVDYLTVKILSM